jgi:hypothetical protein
VLFNQVPCVFEAQDHDEALGFGLWALGFGLWALGPRAMNSRAKEEIEINILKPGA